MSSEPTSYTTRSQTADQTNASYLNTLYPAALLEPNKGLNIREFWNVIVRNKTTLGLTTFLALLAALVISLLMDPVYRASATIQIERPSDNIIADLAFDRDLIDPTNRRRNGKDFWQTQIQLLQSRTMASNVITQLGIKEHFTAKPKFLASLRSAPPTAETTFLKGLTIQPLSNSQLIMIHYEAGDKLLATNIVNSIADIYIESGKTDQREETKSTRDFLIEQKEQIKQRLIKSEAELDDYARKHKIIERDDGVTTQTQPLEKIENEVFKVERQRIDLEEQLKQLDLVIQGEKLSSMPNIPNTKTLYQKLVQFEELYQQEQERDKPSSRKIKRLQKQIKNTQNKIIKAAELHQQQLNSNYATVKLNEEKLRKDFKALQNRSLNQQDKTHTYQLLKKEVISNQERYQSLLDRIKEVGIVGKLDNKSTTVIDSAVIPHKKFKPNVKTNLMLGALVGFLLGLAFIFLREFMDSSIKSTEEVEKITQLPMLGVIPKLKDRDSSVIAQQLITEPDSYIAEAIRSLRTSLSFSTETGAPKILCFTSSAAGEGKTSIATNLAISYALAGESVLLIDADLRKPTIDKLLKLENRIGLSNLLSGQKNQQEFILNTSVTNLHVLNAGPLPPDPVSLLSSNMMQQLLKKCGERYDRVLIDSPPVLGLADALILSNLADATLLVVHAEKTDKELIKNSLKRLKQAQGHVLGTLMNQMPKMNASYAYRQYGKKLKTETIETEPAQSEQIPTSQANSIFKGKIS